MARIIINLAETSSTVVPAAGASCPETGRWREAVGHLNRLLSVLASAPRVAASPAQRKGERERNNAPHHTSCFLSPRTAKVPIPPVQSGSTSVNRGRAVNRKKSLAARCIRDSLDGLPVEDCSGSRGARPTNPGVPQGRFRGRKHRTRKFFGKWKLPDAGATLIHRGLRLLRSTR
jgi:hypothetical protein